MIVFSSSLVDNVKLVPETTLAETVLLEGVTLAMYQSSVPTPLCTLKDIVSSSFILLVIVGLSFRFLFSMK